MSLSSPSRSSYFATIFFRFSFPVRELEKRNNPKTDLRDIIRTLPLVGEAAGDPGEAVPLPERSLPCLLGTESLGDLFFPGCLCRKTLSVQGWRSRDGFPWKDSVIGLDFREGRDFCPEPSRDSSAPDLRSDASGDGCELMDPSLFSSFHHHLFVEML